MAPDGIIIKIPTNFSKRKIKIMFLIRAIILRNFEGEKMLFLYQEELIKYWNFRFMRKDKICEGKLHKTCFTEL